MNVKRQLNILKTIAEDVEPVSNARLAAMVFYRGRPVSFGVNLKKTHPFAAKYSKNPDAIYLHAEASAILAAKKRLSEAEMRKAILIVCRVKYDINGNPNYAIAKPCEGCAKCIEDHGIKTVIYTEDSDKNKVKYTTVLED